MKEYFIGLFSTPRMAVAQVIGFMAMASAIICFQQRERRKILLWQFICCSLWTLHFIILGVATGAAINGMQVARTIVFSMREKKKWAAWPGWVLIFIGITVTIGVVTYSGPLDVLPVIGTSFSTISMWMTNPFVIRLLTFPVSATWGIYDFKSMSISGACNEIFCVISIIIAIFRIDIPNLKKKKTEA